MAYLGKGTGILIALCNLAFWPRPLNVLLGGIVLGCVLAAWAGEIA